MEPPSELQSSVPYPSLTRYLRALAFALSLLGTTFLWLDFLSKPSIGALAVGCAVSGLGLGVITAAVSRSIRLGIRPVLAGCVTGLVFLATIWLLSGGFRHAV